MPPLEKNPYTAVLSGVPSVASPTNVLTNWVQLSIGTTTSLGASLPGATPTTPRLLVPTLPNGLVPPGTSSTYTPGAR